MTILGIETSCDETSASTVKKENQKIKLVSNVIASSLSLHAKTAGIIPEIAAREQIKYIIPVIKESLKDTKISDIDAIAVTYGPGLMGSLFIGVETAKVLSFPVPGGSSRRGAATTIMTPPTVFSKLTGKTNGTRLKAILRR